MSRAVALRLGAFAGAVVLAFGAAYGIGSAIDPIAAADDPSAAPAHGEEMGGMKQASGTGEQLPGLAVSEAGYTFTPVQTSFASGAKAQLRFTIQGPDGKPVTQYTKAHEKDLHLIVVRRDLSGFDHLHPTRDAGGTWSVPFAFASGGTWRMYADFQPAGLDRKLTLGTDVNVSGAFRPVPLAEPSSTFRVDGYDVTLEGDPIAGKETELRFRMSRAGKPVTDLQPYLGAFGHLVSLRGGDLAYLHTHPGQEAAPGSKGGPEVRFATTFPTGGTYRLYLDFQHAGTVHTAEFTVRVAR